jgi:hypothetical protein
MIKRYNNLSFLFFVPGSILQIVGFVLNRGGNPDFARLLMLVGSALAITGFGYYAKAKGRNLLWGLVGFFGLLGILFVAALKDRSGDPWNT